LSRAILFLFATLTANAICIAFYGSIIAQCLIYVGDVNHDYRNMLATRILWPDVLNTLRQLYV
jgi:hypothetical protein